MNKTDRELAFLYDLYVAPDWSERFAELINEHVKMPAKEGRALYVGAATGSHVMLLHERSSGQLTITGVDESADRVRIARAKATAAKRGAELQFQTSRLDVLDYPDNTFALVVGDATMIEPERLPDVLAEMSRVAARGATVALNIVSASSFGEFFSIYWEALHSAELDEHAYEVPSLINELPTVSQVEEMAAGAGLKTIESWTSLEEFHFPSGEEFLQAPLVSDFLLNRWFDMVLPADDEHSRTQVEEQIVKLIDEERADLDFVLSIKATLVAGRKA
ncbi:MAG: class I SAM-dependent methyltransferase [Pyrinomonadaceae bacterium]